MYGEIKRGKGGAKEVEFGAKGELKSSGRVYVC